MGLGFIIGLGILDLGLKVEGLGFWVSGSGLRILRCRV